MTAVVSRFATLQDLAARAGEELAVIPWIAVEQPAIDGFAAASGDRNWIHVDPERAARESPFGGTIAHGFLVLSLIAAPLQDGVQVDSVRMGVNYGLNKVRFIAPVKAGQRIRCRFALTEFSPIAGGAQVLWSVTVEREQEDKPACTAELLIRLYQR